MLTHQFIETVRVTVLDRTITERMLTNFVNAGPGCYFFRESANQQGKGMHRTMGTYGTRISHHVPALKADAYDPPLSLLLLIYRCCGAVDGCH